MLDFPTLQARAEYKRDQFLQEAAHERLLRQVRPAVAEARAARSGPRDRLGSLLVAATVLLLALAIGGLAPSVASSSTLAAPEPAAHAVSMPVDQNAVGLGCWVTGDLVWSPEGSAGNPAAVAQAMCDGR